MYVKIQRSKRFNKQIKAKQTNKKNNKNKVNKIHDLQQKQKQQQQMKQIETCMKSGKKLRIEFVAIRKRRKLNSIRK